MAGGARFREMTSRPHAVVSIASNEACPNGARSAMPMAVARRRCPHTIVIPQR